LPLVLTWNDVPPALGANVPPMQLAGAPAPQEIVTLLLYPLKLVSVPVKLPASPTFKDSGELLTVIV
jgi:hypothetical protein